jgi:hypothetical protein
VRQRAFRPRPESLSRPSFLNWSSTVLIQSRLTLGQAACRRHRSISRPVSASGSTSSAGSMMQRIGRVDRRMNPEVERRLVADHTEVKVSRGKVSFWNFLPPDELNAILSLYRRVTQKTLLISKTLGIEGKKLLTPEDDFDALREFNHAYEGTRTAIEDMHLEYQALLQADPEIEARLKRLPGATFSGRKRPAKGIKGLFFCYALPALDKELGEFTEAAGTTRWYLYDLDRSGDS